MKLKKFIAPTTREALQKLRAELGESAIILSTKQSAAGTEVLAASSQDLDTLTEKPLPPAPVSWTKADRIQSAMQQTEPPLRPAERVAQQVTMQRDMLIKYAPLPESSVALVTKMQVIDSGGEQNPVLDEIKMMQQLLKDQMAMMRWRDTLEKNPQRVQLWNLLTTSGFSPLFARTVVERLPADLTEAQMQDWTMNVLKKNLGVVPAGEDIVEKGGIFALVGPTGVGKTTTTAKMAARCVVKYGADSLGLITTDSYRIGAQDQLRIYGKILGVQVYTAQTQTDLQQLRNSMQRKRLILIDTVGMGQRDSRVAEQTKILVDCHVKRVLLLNATSEPETLDDVVRHYKSTTLNGAILSKLDEAIKIGGVLDVVMRHKLTLHYIATGQRVPEDLFSADPRVLVHRALRSRSNQAFRTSNEELKWKMAQVSATGI